MNPRLPNHRVFLVLLLALVIGAASLSAQSLTSKALNAPFEPREELLYQAEFSRSLLRKVDIADFRFTVNQMAAPQSGDSGGSSDQNSDPRHLLLLTGDVSSKGLFTKLFNLNFHQWVESTVEPVSFTVQRTKRQDQQGKRLRTSEAVFDATAGEVVWTELDPNNPSRGPRVEKTRFTPPVQDILSAIYFLRLQPLAVGSSFTLPISDSGRLYQIPVKVVEKKRFKTLLGRVDAVRVDPQLFGPQGLLNVTGQVHIWITDDQRHLPVSAKIKSQYGTFDITLKQIRNSRAE